MDDDTRDLIFQAIDQTISREDFDRLQDAIEHDDDVRESYLKIVGICDSLGEIAYPDSVQRIEPTVLAAGLATGDFPVQQPDTSGSESPWSVRYLVVAAALLLLVGSGAFWLGRQDQSSPAAVSVRPGQRPDTQAENRIAGHATLRRAVDIVWPQAMTARHEGDVLPNGPLAFEEGVAEIDFFCGATLIVEGPIQLDIESDWSVRVTEGRVRANVPPAARGFVVEAADTTIVDLGTEFALEVNFDDARLEVIDGEVELRGGDRGGEHLVTGQAVSLQGARLESNSLVGLSTYSDLDERRRLADKERLESWKAHSRQLRTDERLIAYFPITEGPTRERADERVVRNAATTGDLFNGLMVGPVERATGRFGPQSTGLDFDRLGSRVRTRIDGEFHAFTFACWAKIDSLENRYNALFMGDGYEDGEPHWQIRDDGSLMFSVMVDDSQEIQHFSEFDQQMVTQAGLHRVYYTQPFWNLSKTGQWFHLVAVYDPAGRQVTQYVNGKRVAQDRIRDKFHISKLRIGPAEIGNWGQPSRKTSWFAIRNLNGTIDEMSIYNAALTASEIKNLYEQGKPVGY